jgi:HAD superfamily hydrolase (TIGR01549 family)
MRAIVLDLFDTVVDLHFDRLPVSEIAGRRSRSTVPVLHAEVARRGHGVDLATFAAELEGSDRELATSHLEQAREVPTHLRFTRALRRMGVIDPELAEILTATHMAQIKSVSQVPPHHREVIAGLAASYPLALCSNFSHAETAREILGQAGLLDHFSAIAISEQVGVRKPRREIFAHALDALGVAPEDVVHVGDNLSEDVAGAAALGMRTAWLIRRVRDAEARLAAHSGPRPNWTITDLADLPPLLERTRSASR